MPADGFSSTFQREGIHSHFNTRKKYEKSNLTVLSIVDRTCHTPHNLPGRVVPPLSNSDRNLRRVRLVQPLQTHTDIDVLGDSGRGLRAGAFFLLIVPTTDCCTAVVNISGVMLNSVLTMSQDYFYYSVCIPFTLRQSSCRYRMYVCRYGVLFFRELISLSLCTHKAAASRAGLIKRIRIVSFLASVVRRGCALWSPVRLQLLKCAFLLDSTSAAARTGQDRRAALKGPCAPTWLPVAVMHR